MANLVIKPHNATGNKVIIQDQAGGAVLTTADSGATLGNSTQDNITRLGTVTSGAINGGSIGSAVTGLGWRPVGSEQNTFSTTNWDITGFNDTYKIWMVQINFMRPASDGKELKIWFLLDNGNLAAGTLQYFSNQYDSGGTTDNQSNTSYPYVGCQMTNGQSERATGSIIVYGARVATYQNTCARMEFQMVKPDGQIGTEDGGMKISGGEVIGGLRLSPWSGNWTEVSAQIYGLNT